MKKSELRQIIRDQLHLLKEYGNQGPSIPKVFELIYNNNEINELDINEVNKINNLVYDFGGGETIYYEDENIVIVDNLEENEIIEAMGDEGIERKIYIKFNLEKYYPLPKANKILVYQLIYHLNNVENITKTINDSLTSDGVVEFATDKITNLDKKFVSNLEKMGFNAYKVENFNKGYIINFSKEKPSNNIKNPLSKINTPQIETPEYKIQQYMNDSNQDTLDLYKAKIYNLPDNMKPGLWMDLGKSTIKELPKGLKIKYDLVIDGTEIKILPPDLEVGRRLIIKNTPLSKKYNEEEIRQMSPGVVGDIILK
jgi:hypothetical protein